MASAKRGFLTSVLVASVLCLLAGFLAGRYGLPSAPERAGLAGIAWPQLTLNADSAAANDSFAVATGAIDQDVEGFYVLDCLTGELSCRVLYYRTGKFGALFRTNVAADLQIDQAAGKQPRYLITSGQVNFPRGTGTARPAQSVVYVLDTNTGNYAAYGLPWHRELVATARPQAGPLTLLDFGKARTAALRE